MADIFISYASEDRAAAQQLYADLTSAGMSCWLDTVSLQPGQEWELEIEEAIRQSRYFLAVISETSVTKRGYVQKELRHAIDLLDEFAPRDIFIIPVRIAPCIPLHHRLAKLQWVDLFVDYNDGLERIIKSISLYSTQRVFRESNTAEQKNAILQSLIESLKSPDPKLRAKTAEKLGMLGPLAKETIEQLITCINDTEPSVRTATAKALVDIGLDNDVVKVLFAALPNLDYRTVNYIFNSLDISNKSLPSLYNLAENYLKTQVNTPEPKHVYTLIRFIASFGPQALPVLLLFLNVTDNEHHTQDYRALVAEVITPFGSDSAPAIPLLLKAIYSNRDNVYKNASIALYSIGSEGIQATIAELKKNPCSHTAYPFFYFHSGAEDAVPHLISLLEKGNKAAAQGLGGIRSDAARVVPVLIVAAGSPDPEMRRRSVDALGHLGEGALEALNTLITALQDSDYYVRRQAAAAIGKLGPKATSAIPALEIAARDKEEKIRRYANFSIHQIRGSDS